MWRRRERDVVITLVYSKPVNSLNLAGSCLDLTSLVGIDTIGTSRLELSVSLWSEKGIKDT